MNENIGVYVCECGPNIKDRIDIDKIIEEISSTEKVKFVKRFPLLCSNDGKTFLEEEIKKEELTHLVIAACSPREHEKTFMGVCERGGLNPYLLQMINIREQCAWMIEDKDQATRKAIKEIRAGISRVALHAPLEQKEIESNPDVLVIGGGISGIEAALSLAGKNRKVYLVEKMESLGGMGRSLSHLLPYQGTSISVLEDKMKEVEKTPAIEVLTSSEVTDIRGFLGNFEVVIHTKNQDCGQKEIKAGAIVVAIGSRLFDSKEHPSYGQGRIENVLTSLEFEAMLGSKKLLLANGKTPKSVALVHCVGRKEKEYCSKVCCLYSLRYAHYLKDNLPEVEVFELHSDLCLPHKADQDFYEEAKKKKVSFIRTEKDVQLKQKGDQIEVVYGAAVKDQSIKVDMVVLSPAMIPAEGASGLAEMLNIPLDKSGFFKEIHEILDPVSTPVEGVYIVGCAAGPKNIVESITQAQAATGKIFSSLIPGKKIITEAKVCEVREDFCTGCQTCLSVCFYGAISFDGRKGVSVVNEAICRGCGSCVGSCPSGAIRSKHFTYPQLYKEVLAALSQ